MLSEEQQQQVLSYVRNEDYSSLAFLIFDVIFNVPELNSLKDDFLDTDFTDYIERKAKSQTPPDKSDDFIIGSINQDIGSFIYGLQSGIITKESFSRS